VTASADVVRFRAILSDRLGLSLAGTSADDLTALLAERVAAVGRSPAAYLDELAAGPLHDEPAVLAPRLTVPETYLFRHMEQLRAVAEVVVPQRVRARGSAGELRVLSAGCATGDEAYTLAMVVRDALPGPAWTVSVDGVDLNPGVLRLARRGRFSTWSLRATPEAVRRRWFHPDGDGMVVCDEIRRMVRFLVGNLVENDPRWSSPGGYDVVFCRNVLMYLTPRHAADAVARLVTALAPGGFLFLGHAETAYGRAANLDLRHSHETFYFQRTADLADSAEPAPAAPQAVPVSPDRRRPQRPRRSATDVALDLLRQERLVEALAMVTSEPGPEARLLRAALLTDLGRLEEAEAECHRMLDANGLDAGAHYLLAVCREGAGDLGAATSLARTAAHLDPGFAMPRLRLGLLARRRGDLVTAGHEFAAALTLLASETDRRLSLFGGGFSRSALTAMCRTGLPAGAGAA
jgi:chemotaxis protein methyltransferase CheR